MRKAPPEAAAQEVYRPRVAVKGKDRWPGGWLFRRHQQVATKAADKVAFETNHRTRGPEALPCSMCGHEILLIMKTGHGMNRISLKRAQDLELLTQREGEYAWVASTDVV